MARCGICEHASRVAIDADVVAQLEPLAIAQRHGVSRAALSRHVAHGPVVEVPKGKGGKAAPPGPPAQAQAPSARELAVKLAEHARETILRLTTEEMSGRDEAALMNAARSAITAFGGFTGELRSDRASAFELPEVTGFLKKLTRALVRHPSALAEVELLIRDARAAKA